MRAGQGILHEVVPVALSRHDVQPGQVPSHLIAYQLYVFLGHLRQDRAQAASGQAGVDSVRPIQKLTTVIEEEHLGHGHAGFLCHPFENVGLLPGFTLLSWPQIDLKGQVHLGVRETQVIVEIGEARPQFLVRFDLSSGEDLSDDRPDFFSRDLLHLEPLQRDR